MFKKSLEHVLSWSAHPRAPLYLGAVSFAESSFFPIPPDVLLAPMVVSKPERAWRLAGWTTLWSVVGGVAAFTVAAFATEAVADFLHENGNGQSYLRAQAWFATPETIAGQATEPTAWERRSSSGHRVPRIFRWVRDRLHDNGHGVNWLARFWIRIPSPGFVIVPTRAWS